MVNAGERLPVLFLWHHHQPFYQGPNQERPLLPWVRLHAVRGYNDMLAAVENGARVTFNFSPCLLEQLEWAASQEICDEFERVALVPTRDLTETDKTFLLSHFFSINWGVHVKPHSRYADLLSKRGEQLNPAVLRQALAAFSQQDYRDLTVLFHLAWIGFAGRKDAEVAVLMKKSSGYTDSDTHAVLQVHHRILREIIPGYRRLQERGQIEISTSPYSHAILPLLCDSRVAAPEVPRLHLPRPEYARPRDVDLQLALAIQTHERIWGERPKGLWPSEGSVSDDVLATVGEKNFRWAATDQGILERSERTTTGNGTHFQPYGWKAREFGLRLFFRDRALSDAIGFRYAHMAPGDAVTEFEGHLERIEEITRDTPERCVVIALDGENPWESYGDGGEGFLNGVYRGMENHPHLQLSTFAEHLQHGVREHVRAVHPGSWIDSNFRIWIGDPAKNQAWHELNRARAALDDLNAGDTRRDECQRWLLRAQGSDWFWWFGDPFSSAYKPQFDELFRSFLRAVYAAAGRKSPPSLDVPIQEPVQAERRVQPVFPIAPMIDGRENSYYEWAGACRIDPRQYGTVMGRAEHLVRAFYYGFGEHEVFFRVDPPPSLFSSHALQLTLHVLGQRELIVSARWDKSSVLDDGDGYRLAFERFFEIAVMMERIGLPRGGECQVWLELSAEGVVLEKLPPEGAYHFLISTDEALAAHWVV